MDVLITQFITILCAVIASSGFWTFLQSQKDKKDVKSDLLKGLAHDRIIALGMEYLERGYIYDDEYENLVDYLYDPYRRMGGNGTAKKIIEDVKRLEIRHHSIRGDSEDED